MSKIFIAAHYSMNNGDRAVLEATINKLFEYDKNVQVVVSASNPQAIVDARFKTVGWPLKNGKIYKMFFWLLGKIGSVRLMKLFYKIYISQDYLYALKECDIVLITGGHHLTDILGSRNYYNLAINFLIPAFEGKAIYLMPQSIGPVNDSKMKKITKYILNSAKKIAYRDDSSKKFLDELKIKTNYEYVPDIVFSLPKSESMKNDMKIGIALYCSYFGEKRDKLMPWIIDNLIEVVNEYAKKGFRFSIISMDPNDIEIAEKIVSKCNQMCEKNVICIEKANTNNILDIIDLFSNKELILAYKTHSVIFSLINKVPVVAIAYHPKSIEFMESVDLNEYSIEDRNASKDNLSSIIELVRNNRDEIIEKERIGVQSNVRLIDAYIKTIFNI